MRGLENLFEADRPLEPRPGEQYFSLSELKRVFGGRVPKFPRFSHIEGKTQAGIYIKYPLENLQAFREFFVACWDIFKNQTFDRNRDIAKYKLEAEKRIEKEEKERRKNIERGIVSPNSIAYGFEKAWPAEELAFFERPELIEGKYSLLDYIKKLIKARDSFSITKNLWQSYFTKVRENATVTMAETIAGPVKLTFEEEINLALASLTAYAHKLFNTVLVEDKMINAGILYNPALFRHKVVLPILSDLFKEIREGAGIAENQFLSPFFVVLDKKPKGNLTDLMLYLGNINYPDAVLADAELIKSLNSRVKSTEACNSFLAECFKDSEKELEIKIKYLESMIKDEFGQEAIKKLAADPNVVKRIFKKFRGYLAERGVDRNQQDRYLNVLREIEEANALRFVTERIADTWDHNIKDEEQINDLYRERALFFIDKNVPFTSRKLEHAVFGSSDIRDSEVLVEKYGEDRANKAFEFVWAVKRAMYEKYEGVLIQSEGDKKIGLNKSKMAFLGTLLAEREFYENLKSLPECLAKSREADERELVDIVREIELGGGLYTGELDESKVSAWKQTIKHVKNLDASEIELILDGDKEMIENEGLLIGTNKENQNEDFFYWLGKNIEDAYDRLDKKLTWTMPKGIRDLIEAKRKANIDVSLKKVQGNELYDEVYNVTIGVVKKAEEYGLLKKVDIKLLSGAVKQVCSGISAYQTALFGNKPFAYYVGKHPRDNYDVYVAPLTDRSRQAYMDFLAKASIRKIVEEKPKQKTGETDTTLK